MKTTAELTAEWYELNKKSTEIQNELERRFRANPTKCEECGTPLIWRWGGPINREGLSVYPCECQQDPR